MTTIKYHAVVPTIGKSPYLIGLLERLLADEGCALIDLPDNGDARPGGHALSVVLRSDRDVHPEVYAALASGRIMLRRTGGTIYRSWNEAMDAARYTPVAVLNDDIVLGGGAIQEALRHLDAKTPIVGLEYRRRVSEGTVQAPVREVAGTYRTGGLGGFAFVVQPDRCARVDARFQWWYGDDDLIRRTLDMDRRVVVATGAPVDHPSPSMSGNQMAWLGDAISADTALWEESVIRG